jgi:uncharacterized protein YjbJ (UPF0337 family)
MAQDGKASQIGRRIFFHTGVGKGFEFSCAQPGGLISSIASREARASAHLVRVYATFVQSSNASRRSVFARKIRSGRASRFWFQNRLVRERGAEASVRVSNLNERTNMKSGARDQVEGKGKELKGAAKQEFGKATGDPGKKAEGSMEKAAGKFQQKTGEIKREATRDD